MPTEIQVSKFVCNICGYPHETYENAILCENAKLSPEHVVYYVKQIINFRAEDNLTESRSVTTFIAGLVLAKLWLTSKVDNNYQHHIGYLVKCEEEDDGYYWEERIVMWGDGVTGEKELYSPPNFKYKMNFHQNLPKSMKLIDHINNYPV